METYNQHIELINQYLNNLLSEEALLNFKKRLESDLDFKNIYQDHLVFIEGINRVALKKEISNAHQSYITSKWIKLLVISIVTIGALILFYILIFNQSAPNKNQSSDSINPSIIQLDSITNSETKLDTIAIDSNTVNSKYTNQDTLKTKSKLILKPFKKQPQTIIFNASKDTSITCNEGTILNIKANSFVFSDSKTTVKSKVVLNVTEYYKLSDMLLANLTTTSNEKQLETGGMLYIDAYVGEQRIQLNENADIEISFPKQNHKEGMQLFSGINTNNKINWVLQKDQFEAIEINEVDIEVPFAVIEQAPIFPGCEDKSSEDLRRDCFKTSINKHIHKNFNIGVVAGININGTQRINTVFKINKLGLLEAIQSNASHPKLIEEANRVIALLPKMIPGKQRGKAVTVPYSLPFTFNIQGEGQNISARFGSTSDIVNYDPILIDSKTEYDTIFTSVRGITETIREIMHDKDFVVDSTFANQWRKFEKQNLIRVIGLNSEKKVILRKPLFEMQDSPFKVLETDSITRGGHIVRVPLDRTLVPSISKTMSIEIKQPMMIDSVVVSSSEFENRVNNEKDNLITSNDVSYYTLRSTNLGWINCDRFLRNRNKLKYKLKIKNANNTTINMVFKSYNSILPSKFINNEFDFGTVVNNEEIVIVAIKREEGKLFFDIIETNTNNTPILNLKETTLDELQLQIKELNTIFN